MRIGRITTLVLGLFLLALPAFGANILIFGPSITLDPNDPNNPSWINEQTVAEDNAHSVTVVDASAWAGMTTEDFASYDAIIVGDHACEADPNDLDPVEANKDVWGPAITGNVVIGAFDPGWHANYGDKPPQAYQYLENIINWIPTGAGTGFYYGLGCWDRIDFLSVFGYFDLNDNGTNSVMVPRPDHPLLAGLSLADLDQWNSSTHSAIRYFPPGFAPVVTDLESGGASLLANDAATPVPAASHMGLVILLIGLAFAGAFVLRR